MPEAADAPAGPKRLGAVLLAAGGSSRMGAVKQLLDIGGRPMATRAVDAALRSGARPVVVVLGANAEVVRAAIADRPIVAAHNAQWQEGVASSIRTGLAAALAADPSLDAVLLAPCDQPGLSADVIVLLASLHRATGRTSAARYHGRNGAPAVFGRDHFGALMALRGDEGARRLLNSEAERVAAVDLPELGADIDTPEDYAAWNDRPA
jgi:molybdenum cofactor cytidylyltransferase